MLSYSRLWLLLHRRGYSPRDIIRLAGISESTYRKMSRSEAVRMDVLERVQKADADQTARMVLRRESGPHTPCICIHRAVQAACSD